jgi:hypothetical protein
MEDPALVPLRNGHRSTTTSRKEAPVAGPLTIVNSQIRGEIRFGVTFNHAPDLYTVDQSGRVRDSFQWYIAYDPSTNPEASDRPGAVVRGDEIHVAHGLRIRNKLPSSSDPTTGGWGTVRATVPFDIRVNLNGTAVLSFVASWTDLGISGPFAWAVDAYNFGAAQDSRRGVFP